MFAEVVFSNPIPKGYYYWIPDDLKNKIFIGSRVLVNLKNRTEEGIVLDIKKDFFESGENIHFKKIEKNLDDFPLLIDEQILLARWMEKIYFCEIGEALNKMYPKPVKIKNIDSLKNQINKKIYKENLVQLTEEQNKIYLEIKNSLTINKPSIHLIQGITGSGKTEIYLHCIVETLLNNKQVLFLVPEISLTIQMIERIKKIVGENLSVLHSGLSAKERYSEYLKILFKQVDVVLGTRSSIFAPLENLGMIIIDEEHDSSFRENSHPRYDARFIARKRIELNQIPLVLGSATPRIEIRYATQKNNNKEEKGILYKIYFLRKRVLGELPKVQIIEKDNLDQPISTRLLNEIEKTIKNNKQAIILLNRRGYTPYLYCKKCQTTMQCPNCSISLTLHKTKQQKLKCHYCNFQQDAFFYCPKCNTRLLQLGIGIQKLEEFLISVFPDLKIARIDTDTNKNLILRETLQEFIRGEIPILIGTQMIAKGLDAPKVNLVGVLQAEEGLYLPDFRATERTFSLLLQVAGRAGRRDHSGMVFLEVQNKENPYIQWAIRQDYESFYKYEVQQRHQFDYPPFCRLIRFLIRSANPKHSEMLIQELALELESLVKSKLGLYQIIGPAPAPIVKMNNKYRNHFLLKTKFFEETLKTIKEKVLLFKKRLKEENYLEIEIDPVDLL
ncbi:MAG: primosomal protein N' [Leptonema sp. (in: bacteria)]